MGRNLKSLNAAFDPLGNAAIKSADSQAMAPDVLEVSSENVHLTEGLNKRLLGSYAQHREETASKWQLIT